MTTLRWVCLSDTHFGAENSLLSHVSDDASVDPDSASPVLEGLIACLREVVPRGAPLPTLVLNGDILELARVLLGQNPRLEGEAAGKRA